MYTTFTKFAVQKIYILLIKEKNVLQSLTNVWKTSQESKTRIFHGIDFL